MIYFGCRSTETLYNLVQEEGKIAATDVASGISCLHPACLQASLSESLAALNLETVCTP